MIGNTYTWTNGHSAMVAGALHESKWNLSVEFYDIIDDIIDKEYQ